MAYDLSESLDIVFKKYRKIVITKWDCGKECPECELKMYRKKKYTLHKIIERVLFLKVKHYFCKNCNTSRLNFR